MDHQYIEESDLVRGYLTGRLGAEEAAEFEEHFVDCPQCVDRLRSTKSLMEGLRFVAREQPAEAQKFDPVAVSPPKRNAIYGRSFALAAGVLFLIALGLVVFLFIRMRHSRLEADQARNDSAEWERRYEDERQSASLAEARHQDSERDLTAQLSNLRAEQSDHPQIIEGTAGQGGSNEPQINLAIFVLNSVRGAESANGSLNEITVPRSPANFVISVPLEGEEGYKTYRTTLLDQNRKQIWAGTGLKADRYNSLSIGCNSTFFAAGNYLLTVEGVAPNGATSVVGKYAFRVIKNP